MTFGDALAQWRLKRKLRLIDMERLTGVIYVHVHKWETGKATPQAQSIARLAQALGVCIVFTPEGDVLFVDAPAKSGAKAKAKAEREVA